MPINRSNFTSAFFKDASYASSGAENNEQDQDHIFQDIYSKSC